MSIRSFDERQKARYSSLSDGLYADYNAIKDLFPKDAHHNAVNGSNNERLLIELFNAELTNGYTATSGFIVSRYGEMTSQIDIIIYEDTTPLIFNKAGISIVPLDGVRAIIEVKSTLNGIDTNNENSLSKIINKMISDDNNFLLEKSEIVFGVFAYKLKTQKVDLTQLKRIFRNDNYKELKFCIHIDESNFVMSFEREGSATILESSHEYFSFSEQLAVGYFLDNMRYIITGSSEIYTNYLFPSNGKIDDGGENRHIYLNREDD